MISSVLPPLSVHDRCRILASYGPAFVPATGPAGCLEPPELFANPPAAPVAPAGEPAPYLPPVMRWYFRLARPVSGAGPRGVNRPAGDPTAVTPAPGVSPFWAGFWGVASVAAAGVSAYHGYKRNDVKGGSPLGWALWWGFWGGLAPVITPVIALAMGYAEPKRD